MADATAEVFLKDSRINRVALLIGDEQSLVVARAWSNDRDVSQLPGRESS